MKFYLRSIIFDMIFISICNILILNTLLNQISVWYGIWQVVANTAYVIVVDILIVMIAYFILPKKWFNPNAKIYNVSDKERKFYNFLKIRKWKDVIPAGIGFRKDKVYEKDNPEYIQLFLNDSAIAETEHLASAIIGFIIIFINPFTPFKYAMCFSLPVAIVNAFLHVMPVMVQRYNRPKLKLLLQRLRRNKTEVKE